MKAAIWRYRSGFARNMVLYNGSIMVDEGVGYALCLDKIINVSGSSNLIFRPLFPKIEMGTHLIWKKYQILSKAAQKFASRLQEMS